MAGSLIIGAVRSDMKSGVDAADGRDGEDVSGGGGTGDIIVTLALATSSERCGSAGARLT